MLPRTNSKLFGDDLAENERIYQSISAKKIRRSSAALSRSSVTNCESNKSYLNSKGGKRTLLTRPVKVFTQEINRSPSETQLDMQD